MDRSRTQDLLSDADSDSLEGSFGDLFQSANIIPKLKNISSSHSGYIDHPQKGRINLSRSGESLLHHNVSGEQGYQLRRLRGRMEQPNPYSVSSLGSYPSFTI